MVVIIHDRIFWIYFIVTFFFIIIGVGSILSSSDPYLIIISIFWLLSNIFLMILVYHASVNWGPSHTLLSTDSTSSKFFHPDTLVWIFVNVSFIVLLILSILWAAELRNRDNGPLRTMSGVLILLGGLILCALAYERNYSNHQYITPFWFSVAYLIIWFGLTLYAAITSS